MLHAFERIKDSRIHLPFHWQHLCWIILESWEHVSHFPLHNGLWTEATATLATFELKRQSWRSNRFTTSTTSPMGGYGSSIRDIRPTDINRSWSVFVFVISTVSNPKCIEPKSAHQGCWNQLRVGMVTGWLPDGYRMVTGWFSVSRCEEYCRFAKHPLPKQPGPRGWGVRVRSFCKDLQGLSWGSGPHMSSMSCHVHQTSCKAMQSLIYGVLWCCENLWTHEYVLGPKSVAPRLERSKLMHRLNRTMQKANMLKSVVSWWHVVTCRDHHRPSQCDRCIPVSEISPISI